MTTWWEAGAFAFTDGTTATGTVDGRTWTINGSDIRGDSGPSLRSELANAIGDQVIDEWGVTVTPYPPKQASPPHIWIDFDDPFFDPVTFAGAADVWAYKAVLVVPARHQAAYDWFERIGPLIDTAVRTVQGARFEQMTAPTWEELGEDRRYLTSEANITIKRARS